MSIHDESWDRPICKFCRKEIGYGAAPEHRRGKCLGAAKSPVALGEALVRIRDLKAEVAELIAKVEPIIDPLLRRFVAERCPSSDFVITKWGIRGSTVVIDYTYHHGHHTTVEIEDLAAMLGEPA